MGKRVLSAEDIIKRELKKKFFEEDGSRGESFDVEPSVDGHFFVAYRPGNQESS